MSTTIRVSDETKSMLSVLKEDDESWDEFLNRLARRERDVEAIGGFGEDGLAESMERTNQAMSESFEDNIERR
jgi:predicted CopG family antitoxin